MCCIPQTSVNITLFFWAKAQKMERMRVADSFLRTSKLGNVDGLFRRLPGHPRICLVHLDAILFSDGHFRHPCATPHLEQQSWLVGLPVGK